MQGGVKEAEKLGREEQSILPNRSAWKLGGGGQDLWEGGGPVVAPVVLAFKASQAINLFICGLHKTYYNVCPFGSPSLSPPSSCIVSGFLVLKQVRGEFR